ncbi:sulfotransferase family 2 domain-containing protein [Nocardioides pelophilus]|uniref:sulfotransferase family 2 domain-containing protein n=1 Tax=Nocardioides pelophilus TaxID=2172019 RepID=UPI0016023898|nr:sulfotransferase family 2 domain-containing protein [Nocardioides pelophilus]
MLIDQRSIVSADHAGSAVAAAEPSERAVIFHYHLFKNAGTSLDALFQEQFAGRWVTREFPPQPGENRRAVRDWIGETPDAVCFSSHTALLPPPVVPRTRVLPVIFVRHPLDRIASAYSFERKQGDLGFGSTLARHTSLAGYVETRLSLPRDRQCRNFHTARFADMTPAKPDDELPRALRALEELPFVGLVETFEVSLQKLQSFLEREGFEGIDLRPVKHNVSRDRALSLDERLDGMASELGAELYAELERANADDLRFYAAAVKAAGQDTPSDPE